MDDEGGGIGDGVVRSAPLPPNGPNGGVVTTVVFVVDGRAENVSYISTHQAQKKQFVVRGSEE
jgi:hypothetical protein